MNVKWLLGSGLIILALVVPLNASALPPNVVLILADDAGFADFGC